MDFHFVTCASCFHFKQFCVIFHEEEKRSSTVKLFPVMNQGTNNACLYSRLYNTFCQLYSRLYNTFFQLYNKLYNTFFSTLQQTVQYQTNNKLRFFPALPKTLPANHAVSWRCHQKEFHENDFFHQTPWRKMKTKTILQKKTKLEIS